jgi:transketolase
VEKTAKRERLEKLALRIRRDILVATRAGSGATSSRDSRPDGQAALRRRVPSRRHPERPDNDRLIFSKGHASPLLYALWAAAGAVTEAELSTLRRFGSPLEGHPTTAFRFTEASTGSLGQGLSVGLGMALNARYLDRLPYRTWVLLGDSEMAEGSQWEAIQAAAFHHLDNLVAVLDVNRLGQRGETMYGRDVHAYATRVGAFGWETLVVDGHDMGQILAAFERSQEPRQMPLMIIARTIKGKGVSFVEDRNGWHGKALSAEQLELALRELGPVDTTLTAASSGRPALPRSVALPLPSSRYPTPGSGRSRRAGRTATR